MKPSVIRWSIRAALAVAFVLAAGFGVAELRWTVHRHRHYAVPPLGLGGPRGDAKRGAYFVGVGNGCTKCHGEDLAGKAVIWSAPVARIWGANLTPAGLAGWSDGEIARAIHDGIGKDGRALVLMPSRNFQWISRRDVADMVAYLRTLAPVARAARPTSAGPLMLVLWNLGIATDLLTAETVDHARPYPDAVPEGPTRAYGAYLYRSHCAGCHRDDARGGHVSAGPPNWPPAANLTQLGAGGWTRAGFIRAMRTGINPSGGTIQPPMGEAIRVDGPRYKESDLVALWEYLRTVPGEDFGF